MTIKWFKPPFNCVIFSLTQPQVANQQKKKKKNCVVVPFRKKIIIAEKVNLKCFVNWELRQKQKKLKFWREISTIKIFVVIVTLLPFKRILKQSQPPPPHLVKGAARGPLSLKHLHLFRPPKVGNNFNSLNQIFVCLISKYQTSFDRTHCV